MPSERNSEIHIGQADVEKIPLGQNKFLYHISDRFFINDDQDGKKIWREIPPAEPVSILGQGALLIPQQLFYGKERITLSAHDLFLKHTQGVWRRQTRVFCNHISFRAEPGKLTGIMGPSGAGKTVLLNLLSGYGYSRKNRGHVFINDTYDVHKARRALGRTIGYVPQDDTLIPNLTVRDSLGYCFQLRYAGVDADLKAHIVRDACQKAGFSGDAQKLTELLRTRIGSPDEKTLSGGERKRVNIAHELIRNPLLLFLDEPTSGLSSVDADNVIESLQNLCKLTEITIILTIHQPSPNSFAKLDNLLVVNRGGNIAYLGAATDAVPYFQEKSDQPCQANENPADFILKALDRWTTNLKKSGETEYTAARKILDVYQSDPHYFPFEMTARVLAEAQEQGLAAEIAAKLRALPPTRCFWRRDFLDMLAKTIGTGYAQEKAILVKAALQLGRAEQLAVLQREQTQALPPLSTSFWQQFGVLFRRNHAVARADRNNRLFQILQPVVIAALILITFAQYAQDYYTEDIFSKVGYYLTKQSARKTTIFIRQDLPTAKKWAYAENTLFSEGSANRRAAVFFLLIASCIWFGIINSCKEIVDERAVLKREAKSTLRIASYLAAKVVFLGWICFEQTVLLAGIVLLPNLLLTGERFLPPAWFGVKYALRSAQLLPDVTCGAALGIGGILFVTAVLASWLGLFISALAPTQKTALTLVPMLIIPQLLLGGLIRPIKDFAAPTGFVLTPQAVDRLSKQMSPEVGARLAALQDRQFHDAKIFLAEAQTLLGLQAAAQFRNRLLQEAKMPSFWGEFRLLPALMLQQWAFEAVLLHQSLAQPNVLKKVLDFNRYREYEYLQFETVSLIEMFFEVEMNPGQARQILYRTLAGMILFHFVLLLLPTYAWLRRKLLM